MNDLTLEKLKKILSYDKNTGNFTWVRCNKSYLNGTVAGGINSLGYATLTIDNKRYAIHRLAWLYIYNKWPNGEIDHKNGITHDNRIENLREATKIQNLGNSKIKRRRIHSLPRGVSKAGYGFIARLASKYLGFFKTAEEAAQAYENTSKIRYGEFSIFNRK